MSIRNINDLLDGVTSENAHRITVNNPIAVLEWRQETEARLLPSFFNEAHQYLGENPDHAQLPRLGLQDSILNNPLAKDTDILEDARTYIGTNI